MRSPGEGDDTRAATQIFGPYAQPGAHANDILLPPGFIILAGLLLLLTSAVFLLSLPAETQEIIEYRRGITPLFDYFADAERVTYRECLEAAA